MSDKFPKFIVFEGVDGTGKSTQMRLLAEALRSVGHTVATFNAPSENTPVGNLIRSQILSPTGMFKEITGDSVGMLFLTSLRELALIIANEHYDTDYVLMDRWWMTTVAYNQTGYVPGSNQELTDMFLGNVVWHSLFEQLTDDACDNTTWDDLFRNPTMVFRMKMDAAAIAMRIAERIKSDRYDTVNIATIEARQERYANVFSANDDIDHWASIDADQSEHKVHADIMIELMKEGIVEIPTSSETVKE